MKRTGNLYNEISDTENLLLAYYKAKKSKEAKKEVIRFSKDVKNNIAHLQREIVAENVKVGDYHYFTIYDPKQRVICAASFRERILHHAIMNVCHQVFENFQIFDSYATRPNKGQYAALERAKHFNKQHQWFCKLDIRKYFDSISHQILLAKLQHKFKDEKLLALFRSIIGSYQVAENCGIPIGNLTSQYFANYYLGFADHYAKEVLKVKSYIRYMDDIVLWGSCKTELMRIAGKYLLYLHNELQLETKPLCVHRVEKGLPYLGYVLFKSHTRLNRRSKKRFMNKFNEYENCYNTGFWSQKELSNHVVPLLAFVQHAHSKQLVSSIMQKEKEVCQWAPTA